MARMIKEIPETVEFLRHRAHDGADWQIAGPYTKGRAGAEETRRHDRARRAGRDLDTTVKRFELVPVEKMQRLREAFEAEEMDDVDQTIEDILYSENQ